MEDPTNPKHYIHVEDASTVTVGTDDKQPIDVVTVSNTGDDLNITHAKQFIDSLDRVWARPAVFMDTMFVGKADGTLQWMEEPPEGYEAVFDGIDVGRSASPCVFEWQSQTYMIVGNRDGDLRQFKLNGNKFVAMNEFTIPDLDIQLAMPAAAVWDDTLHLVVGHSGAKLYYYKTTTKVFEYVPEADSIFEYVIGSKISPAFVDINGDAYTDLIVSSIEAGETFPKVRSYINDRYFNWTMPENDYPVKSYNEALYEYSEDEVSGITACPPYKRVVATDRDDCKQKCHDTTKCKYVMWDGSSQCMLFDDSCDVLQHSWNKIVYTFDDDSIDGTERDSGVYPFGSAKTPPFPMWSMLKHNWMGDATGLTPYKDVESAQRSVDCAVVLQQEDEPENVYCLNPDQLSEWLVRPDCVKGQDTLSTYTTGDNNGQKNINYNSGEGCPDARAYNPNGDKDYLWHSLDLDYAVCDISNEDNIDIYKDNRQRHADLWRTDKDGYFQRLNGKNATRGAFSNFADTYYSCYPQTSRDRCYRSRPAAADYYDSEMKDKRKCHTHTSVQGQEAKPIPGCTIYDIGHPRHDTTTQCNSFSQEFDQYHYNEPIDLCGSISSTVRERVCAEWISCINELIGVFPGAGKCRLREGNSCEDCSITPKTDSSCRFWSIADGKYHPGDPCSGTGHESGTACVNNVCKITTTLSAKCRGERSGEYGKSDNAPINRERWVVWDPSKGCFLKLGDPQAGKVGGDHPFRRYTAWAKTQPHIRDNVPNSKVRCANDANHVKVNRNYWRQPSIGDKDDKDEFNSCAHVCEFYKDIGGCVASRADCGELDQKFRTTECTFCKDGETCSEDTGGCGDFTRVPPCHREL